MADLGPIADHSDIVKAAHLNGLIFGIPAAILLAIVVILDVPSNYWTPILIVYGIGAMSHVLGFGFEVLTRQIREVGMGQIRAVDAALEELKDQLSGSGPIAPDSL